MNAYYLCASKCVIVCWVAQRCRSVCDCSPHRNMIIINGRFGIIARRKNVSDMYKHKVCCLSRREIETKREIKWWLELPIGHHNILSRFFRFGILLSAAFVVVWIWPPLHIPLQPTRQTLSLKIEKSMIRVPFCTRILLQKKTQKFRQSVVCSSHIQFHRIVIIISAHQAKLTVLNH